MSNVTEIAHETKHTNEMTVMKDDNVVMTGTIKVAREQKSSVATNSGKNADGKD